MCEIKPVRVAILGSSGHISRCTADVLQDHAHITLFGRSSLPIESLHKHNYDVIINGTGATGWTKNPQSILAVTEYFDAEIDRYQDKHPDCLAIHFSSGAVYGHDFSRPANTETKMTLPPNQMGAGDFYTIAKLYSEARHRTSGANIVDLRIFGFYSRFIDIHSPLLLCEILRCLREKRPFITTKRDIFRDYIHRDDFRSLLLYLIEKRTLNMSIDVRSTAPTSKSEMLKHFQGEYGLLLTYADEASVSPTGEKPHYYSVRENPPGICPRYTALESVIAVTRAMM